MIPAGGRPWLLHGAALLSALLASAAWPPIDWPLLAWIAWCPWLAVLATRPGLRAATTSGVLHFAALHALNCWWFYLVLRSHGGLSPAAAGASTVISLLGPAPHGAIIGLVAALLVRRSGPAGLLGVPFVWAAVEALRMSMPIAVPWALPALTQTGRPEVLGVADLFGSAGVSALVLLGNVAVLLGLRALFARSAPSRRGSLVAAAAAALLVAAGLQYGWVSARRHAPADSLRGSARILPHVPESDAAIYQDVGTHPASERQTPPGSLRVALVQGARPEDVAVHTTTAIDVEQGRRQLLLSALALTASPDLLVWAESAHPDTAARTPYLLQGLRMLLRRDGGGTEAAVGLVIETRGPDGEDGFTNSVALLDEAGILGRYDKHWLVPFGEYVPAARVFFWVERLAGASSASFLAGRGAQPLHSGRADLGISICYEAIFPQQQRALVRNGAEVLVNLTNDGWFHGTPVPEQHLLFSALRAVETRRWVVRCANSGITAVFAPDGSLVARLDEGRQGVLVADVGRETGLTVHARTGYAPVWGAGLLALGWALTRRREREPEPGDPA